ncbi:MAG: ATP-binding protein [Pseudomonadota bacterium]
MSKASDKYSAELHRVQATLARRRKLVDGFFVLLIIASYLALSISIDRSAEDATTINLAGQQRSLTQRIGLLAGQVGLPLSDVETNILVAQLEGDIDLIEESHEFLINVPRGRYSKDISFRLDTAYFTDQGLDSRLRAFIAKGRELVELIVSGKRSDRMNALSTELQDIASGAYSDPDSLLYAQNSIVSLYELGYQAKQTQFRWLLRGILALALVLLIIASILIYTPAIRQSERYAVRLEKERRRVTEFTLRTVAQVRPTIDRLVALVNGSGDRQDQESQLQQATEHIRYRIEELGELIDLDAAGSHVNEFSISEMVERVANYQAQRPEADGVQIETHASVDKMVRGNRAILRGCLDHLVGNAITYRDQSELLPMVSVYADFPSEQECVVTVRDNGVGVPDDRRENLFEARSGSQGFTGVGLSLVRQNIQACGGSVSYSPVIGGSAFELRFPIDSSVAA